MIYQYADTTGNGAGSHDGAVDGSITPVVLKVLPPSGTTYALHRMLPFIRSSRVSFSADTYGNIAALTNGITVQVHNQADDSVVQDLCDGIPIKSNADWARLCFDSLAQDYGTGDRFVSVRWTFSKSGQPLYIKDHQYMGITIQDNLSTLVEHTFMVQGVTV